MPRPFSQLEVTPLNHHLKECSTSGLWHVKTNVAGEALKCSILVMNRKSCGQQKELEELEESECSNSSKIKLPSRI